MHGPNREAGLEPILVSVPRAAQALSVSRRMVWLLIATRRLVPVRLGRRTLVPVEQLRALGDQGLAAVTRGSGAR